MPKLSNIKEFLDWLSHGNLLVQIAIAVGAGKILKGAVLKFTHIPAIWIPAIEWLGAALLLWLFLYLTKRWGISHLALQQNHSSKVLVKIGSGEFNAKEFLGSPTSAPCKATLKTTFAPLQSTAPQMIKNPSTSRF